MRNQSLSPDQIPMGAGKPELQSTMPSVSDAEPSELETTDSTDKPDINAACFMHLRGMAPIGPIRLGDIPADSFDESYSEVAESDCFSDVVDDEDDSEWVQLTSGS